MTFQAEARIGGNLRCPLVGRRVPKVGHRGGDAPLSVGGRVHAYGWITIPRSSSRVPILTHRLSRFLRRAIWLVTTVDSAAARAFCASSTFCDSSVPNSYFLFSASSAFWAKSWATLASFTDSLLDSTLVMPFRMSSRTPCCVVRSVRASCLLRTTASAMSAEATRDLIGSVRRSPNWYDENPKPNICDKASDIPPGTAVSIEEATPWLNTFVF